MSGLRDTLDDEVIGEVDVFLSQPDEDSAVHVLQYPLRNAQIGIGKERRITGMRFRPKHGRIEVNMAVFPNQPNSNEITSADGCRKSFDDTQELTEEKDIGSEQCLRSGTQLSEPCSNFAVGKYCSPAQSSTGRPSFTIVPVRSVDKLRPSFDYLDTFDLRNVRKRLEDKVLQANARGEVEKASDAKAKEVSQLQVSFRKRETEKAAERRKNSYAVFQEREDKEAWIPVDFFVEDDPQVRSKYKKLFEQPQMVNKAAKDEVVFEEETQYTDLYQAHTCHVRTGLIAKGNVSSDPLSVRALQKLPIESSVAQILRHARIVTFNDLIRLISPHTPRQEILKVVESLGFCIRGCWVARKGLREAIGREKVPGQRYDASRVIILDLFRRSRIVSMKEAILALGDDLIINHASVETILKEISDRNRGVGWELRLMDDESFMSEYPEEYRQQCNDLDKRVEQAKQFLSKSVHGKKR